MFDRLVSRATFWAALATFAVLSAVASVELPAAVRASSPFTTAQASLLPSLTSLLPSFTAAAPVLSALALVIAVLGWRLAHAGAQADLTAMTVSHAERLHEAMRASADAVLLLRTLRDADGEITDFEIADANPSAAQLLRAAPGTVTGTRLRSGAPGLLDESHFAQYVDAVALATPLRTEERLHPRRFSASFVLHEAVPVADGLVVTLRDISARKREERRLRRASNTDMLTSLHNRRGFLAHADQALRLARRQEKDVVLLYIDMDQFKSLNDRFGHAEGDRALAAVGRLLRRTVRDCDLVARLGGDEFTVLAIDADAAAARLMQRRIEECIAALNASGQLAAPLALTIGYTRVRPTDDAPVTELLARADALLYTRKRRRKAAALARAHAAARGDAELGDVEPFDTVAPAMRARRTPVRRAALASGAAPLATTLPATVIA